MKFTVREDSGQLYASLREALDYFDGAPECALFNNAKARIARDAYAPRKS